VSRVGGAAQTKAMKKVAASLRLELAQYRELQVFSQLGSDLDAATQDRLNRGEKLMNTLKQKQYAPLPMEEQVIILYCAKNGYLLNIPYYDVARFNQGILTYVQAHYPDILDSIRQTADFAPETESRLKEAADKFLSDFSPSQPTNP